MEQKVLNWKAGPPLHYCQIRHRYGFVLTIIIGYTDS